MQDPKTYSIAGAYKTYAGAYPVGPDAHVNIPLSNFAVEAFNMSDTQFVAPQIMPAIPVDKQSNKYYKILKDEFFQQSTTLRAPKTKANKVEFTLSSDSYFCNNYALQAENAIEDLENADLAVNLRQNSTALIVQKLKLDQEIRVANLITSVSNIGSGAAASFKWSDPNADPVGDVNTGQAFIWSATGLVPNTMVLDWNTYQVVRRCPAMLDMYKFTSGGLIQDEQIKNAFGIDNLYVARGVKNAAAEGQTASMVAIWGNNAVLLYVGQNTGLQSVTFGGRFQWTNPIYPSNFAVKTYLYNWAGERNTEVVEAGYFQTEKVIAPELAYAITSTS